MQLFTAFRWGLTCLWCRFVEIDVGCHKCSVSLRLDGVSHASGACFVGLT